MIVPSTRQARAELRSPDERCLKHRSRNARIELRACLDACDKGRACYSVTYRVHEQQLRVIAGSSTCYSRPRSMLGAATTPSIAQTPSGLWCLQTSLCRLSVPPRRGSRSLLAQLSFLSARQADSRQPRPSPQLEVGHLQAHPRSH